MPLVGNPGHPAGYPPRHAHNHQQRPHQLTEELAPVPALHEHLKRTTPSTRGHLRRVLLTAQKMDANMDSEVCTEGKDLHESEAVYPDFLHVYSDTNVSAAHVSSESGSQLSMKCGLCSPNMDLITSTRASTATVPIRYSLYQAHVRRRVRFMRFFRYSIKTPSNIGVRSVTRSKTVGEIVSPRYGWESVGSWQ